MDELKRIKELLPKLPDIDNPKNILESEQFEIEHTPMFEENKEINSDIPWEKAYHELMLEILDFDLSLVNAKTNFTHALLNAGLKYNPQDLYKLFDLISTRLERIHIVKRMCNFLGLQGEMDKIIDYELDLIYNTPRYNTTKTVDLTNPIAGDKNVGR